MKAVKNKVICFVCICLCLSVWFGTGMTARAEEVGEDIPPVVSEEEKAITGMDEDGNVFEVKDDTDSEPEVDTYSVNENGHVVNFNTKGISATTNFTEDGSRIAGYTCGAYGADAAFLGTSDGKVKFMLAGVVGWVDASDVEVLELSSVSCLSYYTVSGGRLIHKISTSVKAGNTTSSLDNGPAPSYLAEGQKYYSYDGHYFYPESGFLTMLEDYKVGNRANSVNPNDPFYNYFQYLPLRSKTNYSGDDLNDLINAKVSGNSKMRDIGEALVKNQNTYGANALLVTGIAANESAWGASNIAQQKNNLFGFNAVDSNPDDAFLYETVDICLKDFAETHMSKGYLDSSDWRYFGGFLGNKASGMNVKYASDPYWGEKAAAHAWYLDKNGGNADQYQYTIGIKGTLTNTLIDPHLSVNVWAESSTSSEYLYETGKQSESAVIILDKQPKDHFYKIQSDPVLKSNRSGIDTSTGIYDFDSMYAYMYTDALTIVSESTKKLQDVPTDAWYYDSVKFVYDNGIMTGLTQTTFGPEVKLSRAQFATILYRMMGSPDVAYEPKYPDVPDGQFYTKAVLWASQENVGVINGYEDGRFGTNDNITREQMAVMMCRFAEYKHYNVTERANISVYPDVESVSEFSYEAMQWAVGNGLITGDNNLLNPQGEANRAVTATIIQRFMNTFK